MTRTLKGQNEETEKKGKERLEEEIRRHEREIRDLRDREGSERDQLRRDMNTKERDIRALKNDAENLRADLEREQSTNRTLRVRPCPSFSSRANGVGYRYGTICNGDNPRGYDSGIEEQIRESGDDDV